MSVVCLMWYILMTAIFSSAIYDYNPISDAGYNTNGNFTEVSSEEGFSILDIPSYIGNLLLFLGFGIVVGSGIPVGVQAIITLFFVFWDIMTIYSVLSWVIGAL